MEPLKRQIWFTGRVARTRYAVTMILVLAGGWALHLLAQAVAYAIPLVFPFIGATSIVAEFLLLWLTFTLSARRLHDLGRSGWWQLAPLAATTALLALAEPSWIQALGLNEYVADVAILAAFAVYFGFLFSLALVRSDPNSNRFGPAPA
ncbi:DUF805 domain-containing protein [uncultured Phenylobacterium sp.]|uniref:DUF805 domain-containing protein n=1 Tax=uncultured Phenylobacterium sp. TaxID=349273 RepID=UPI0025CCD809|nr:DUF805 domain-containing protein [uncultured Phenylobacterium sp.]